MSVEGIIEELEGLYSKAHEKRVMSQRLCFVDVELLNTEFALKEAIDLLRTHPDAQPNEPLTLEELREMNGQPIWVEHIPYPKYSAWWIIAWDEHGECILAAPKLASRGYTVRNYGDYWLAYRRPPKEVSK